MSPQPGFLTCPGSTGLGSFKTKLSRGRSKARPLGGMGNLRFTTQSKRVKRRTSERVLCRVSFEGHFYEHMLVERIVRVEGLIPLRFRGQGHQSAFNPSFCRILHSLLREYHDVVLPFHGVGDPIFPFGEVDIADINRFIKVHELSICYAEFIAPSRKYYDNSQHTHYDQSY